MAALTRHGTTLRQLQSQEQKLTKKNKLKKRKVKSDAESQVDESSEEQSSGKGDENIDQLKSNIKQTREVVEQLTELTDALLFEGETDAYDLTKADWTHRFKLESIAAKRPPEDLNNSIAAKKPRHNYFGDTSTQNSTATPQQAQVMWEYRGNGDGAIHGPFTSQQMKEWTSCGYFVGESAVDIRRVGSDAESKSEAKSDADDLMADLMDDEDEEKVDSSNEWMRSDAVDFNAYL
jgi:CD2 antigen cytoplasmic tail-binding protein 2